MSIVYIALLYVFNTDTFGKEVSNYSVAAALRDVEAGLGTEGN